MKLQGSSLPLDRLQHPTIAIIVPVLNEEGRLAELFKMLEELSADEVMVVDGGSTDATAELLAQSDCAWCISAAGRAIQMNRGAEQCQSDTVLFLHADTEITAVAVDRVREVMRNPNIVGGRFDLQLSGRRNSFRMIEFFINLRSRLSKISTGDQAMFVRRDIFEKLGGFPDQPLMEDIEFSRRLKRVGGITCLREKVTTSSRRWEKHGVIKTVLLMWKLRLLYWFGVAPEKLAKIYRHAR